MTRRDLDAALRDIETAAEQGDYEKAHSLEDNLYSRVLRAVAEGAPNAAELAGLALQTEGIPFVRHCA